MDLLILGGMVLGITQVLKLTFNLGTRFIPITSLLVSVLLMWLFATFTEATMNWDLVTNAVIAGLTASGLWSGSRATFGSTE